ncbi:type VII secretion target [Mycolicibacterium peregrinum]|uniref:type VII secretion target n=1 Tax=Mycolicibacterium peregrinum TaxID=43304 RepID=UPI0009ED4EA3|nr:type VII secretion target [Mycolicibacterium peregrinum]
MTSPLRVNPATLRSAAGDFDHLGTDSAGTGTNLQFTALPAQLPGLSSGDACLQAGTAVDTACRRVADQYAKLSTNLNSAADTYEKTDADLGKKVKKAGEDTGGPDDGGEGAPPPPAAQHGPEAIPVDQVTYDKGSWPSGQDATRNYINQALDQRGVTDPAARQRWMDAYLTLTEHESSYNPMSVNDWDVNAKPPNSTYNVSDGYGNGCSRGLAQCVPGTFAQYHQPGTSNNIYDPAANIAASMNYLVGEYGVNPDGSDIRAKIPQTNPGTHQGY